MKPDVPKFETKQEEFAWLRENHDELIYQKRAEFKKADAFCAGVSQLKDMSVAKYEVVGNVDAVKVRAVINTTYLMDSHKDVHIDGLWTKTLKENKRIKHLQEHQMAFDKIIADKDDLTAFAKSYEWRELGYDVDGKTEALVFDSNVKESRNATMFKEYKEGNVDNHSVGMYYVKIKFAMNSEDEDDEAFKMEYDKHIDKIANKEEVEKQGYFWAVYEAKAIEGSAVPMGSNPITPTLTTPKHEPSESEIKAKAIKQWLEK